MYTNHAAAKSEADSSGFTDTGAVFFRRWMTKRQLVAANSNTNIVARGFNCTVARREQVESIVAHVKGKVDG